MSAFCPLSGELYSKEILIVPFPEGVRRRITGGRIPMATPKRIDTHEIDTLAYRKMIAGLPASWIERTHTDRDYGIDLQFELLNASVATGGVAFVQLKGKDKAFPKKGALKLGGLSHGIP